MLVSNSSFVFTIGSLKKDLMDCDYVAVRKGVHWYLPDSATKPTPYFCCCVIPQHESLPPIYPVEGRRETSNCWRMGLEIEWWWPTGTYHDPTLASTRIFVAWCEVHCLSDCSSMRCICKKHDPECSAACGHCRGISCTNAAALDFDEDLDEDEDENDWRSKGFFTVATLLMKVPIRKN